MTECEISALSWMDCDWLAGLRWYGMAWYGKNGGCARLGARIGSCQYTLNRPHLSSAAYAGMEVGLDRCACVVSGLQSNPILPVLFFILL